MNAYVLYSIPIMLGIFGVCWYLHIVKIMHGKTDPPLPFSGQAYAGMVLFFVPLIVMLSIMFTAVSDTLFFPVIAVIASIPVSTVFFTSGFVKEYDGNVIVFFLALNIGILGALRFLG